MLQTIIESLRSIGPIGIVLIAILDSSFLTIPEINDIVVVTNVAKRPDLFFYWPLLTTTGSVIGCFLLYLLARKGGQVFLHRWVSSRRVLTIERVFARYGILAIAIPALCPPPTPFKSFVACAGALQFPTTRFVIIVAVARALRYFSMAILAVFYGERVGAFITQHTLMVALIVIGVVTITFLLYRAIEARLEAKRLDAAPVTKNERQCAES